MSRDITLPRSTEQGAKNRQSSAERADDFDAIAEKPGVSIEGRYRTTGSCDGVLIIQSEDDKKALRVLCRARRRWECAHRDAARL